MLVKDVDENACENTCILKCFLTNTHFHQHPSSTLENVDDIIMLVKEYVGDYMKLYAGFNQ